MTSGRRAAERELAVRLTAEFPDLPAESVVRCVLDAADAVDYFDVERQSRAELLERLARAHLENLTGAYESSTQVAE